MNEKIKILFLAAEPAKFSRLRLGDECEQIRQAIDLESNRDRFEVIQHWAVKTPDLVWKINKHQPDVVHFSGHGSVEGIIVEDSFGAGHLVPEKALAGLFKTFKKKPRLIFLNACYTESQARLFRQVIDFTIGMRRPVGDEDAAIFAANFYRGLSFGHSVEDAFKLSRRLLELNASPDKDNAQLLIRKGADSANSFLAHALPSKRNGGAPTSTAGAGKNKPDEPRVCLWIHGWIKRLYDPLPTVELDWTPYFHRDNRGTPGQQVWKRTLFDELQAAKKELARRDPATFVDFRGKLPLTAMLAVGANFPEVNSYRLRAEQPTHGKTVLWRSDASPSKRQFKVVRKKKAKSGHGQDILIALAITGGALEEVTDLYEQHPQTFSAMIYAEPDGGTGDGALRSDRDAVALAIKAKDLIRECKLEYEPKQIHLVVYGPAAYCLFLGQRLNALGRIVTYERSLNGGYKRSMVLQTG